MRVQPWITAPGGTTETDDDLDDEDVPARQRRRLRVALVVGVVGAVVASVAWFVWLPGWRPGLEAGERLGVDVSSHQGSIDWQAVRDDGIAFAYIKASEGRDFTDARFDGNWAAARAAGIDRGAYHYFSLCSTGAEQAKHFLSVAPPDVAALAPAVDLEEVAGRCDAPRERVEREVRNFLTLVEAAWGRRAVLYVSDDFAERFRVRDQGGRPQWRPRLLLRPAESSWLMWQASSFARVDGIDGAVDLDVGRGPQDRSSG